MSQTKYKGTSFEEWYKANFGNEYAPNNKWDRSQANGMSDTDHTIGNKLYDAYIKNNEATTAHNESLATLDRDKASAEQAAKISYMRLQKYLPQQLAKQGLYGTGVTEDAYLKLHNNYMNDIKDIDSNYSDRKTALEQAYRSEMNNRDITTAGLVDDAIEKQKTSNLENYNEASEYLQGGSFATAQDVVNALEQYKGRVSDTQYQMLENTAASLIKAYGYDVDDLADGYVKDTVNAGKLYTTRALDFDSLSAGDDITVKVGGNEIAVESDGEAKSSAVVEYASSNGIKDGELFVFPDDDNAVYLYSGGIAYKIRAKSKNATNVANFGLLRDYLINGSVSKENESVQVYAGSSKKNTYTSTANQKKTKNGRSQGV
jgi:hypothetical protein